jgi:transcriptional regulator with GAF, ATPase, and Fis domain
MTSSRAGCDWTRTRLRLVLPARHPHQEEVIEVARESELTQAFVELADTLVSDYDVAGLLYGLVEHSVSLLNASAAGIMLADQRGGLQVMASTTERTRLLELFQLQNDEGPCLDCFHTGQPVAVPDLEAAATRWPRFAPAALAEGYTAVHALPLRLREQIIGALNLFNIHAGDLPAEDLQVAQALADVATIGILQERAIQHNETLVEQLQGALNSRIIIEQAKGVLAERGGLDMDQAFGQLRAYSRNTNTGLARAARGLVDGHLDATAVLTPQTKKATQEIV